MSWNYRVIAEADRDGEDWSFSICEVYYEDREPQGYIRETTLYSHTLDGIRENLQRMRLALSKPILSAENFPEEWNSHI